MKNVVEGPIMAEERISEFEKKSLGTLKAEMQEKKRAKRKKSKWSKRELLWETGI